MIVWALKWKEKSTKGSRGLNKASYGWDGKHHPAPGTSEVWTEVDPDCIKLHSEPSDAPDFSVAFKRLPESSVIITHVYCWKLFSQHLIVVVPKLGLYHPDNFLWQWDQWDILYRKSFYLSALVFLSLIIYSIPIVLDCAHLTNILLPFSTYCSSNIFCFLFTYFSTEYSF